MLEASMLVIGDEILGGYVVDTNSPWLAERLRAHGIPLTRVHVVPDEVDAIGEVLQLELARRRPRLVLTSGGIGSTPDDITYEAVAASLGRPVVEHADIAARLDRVLAWSRDHGLDVTADFAWHLKRMARIPQGSRVLAREGGWVPAVAVDVDGGCDHDGATVLVLPGVPSEFRAIVEQAVEHQVLAGRNPIPAVVEIEHGFPESALNLAFSAVLERFPGVKLGSYPGRPMLVRLVGDREEVDAAARMVQDALDRLERSPAGEQLMAAWDRRRSDPQDDG